MMKVEAIRDVSSKHSAEATIERVKPLLLDTRPMFAGGHTPCKAIDDALANLIPGQSLVLLIDFEPVPLYVKLGNQGFTHHAKELDDGTWQVEFRRTS